MRLDSYLVEKEYFGSRTKAKDSIEEGFVKVNGNVITKPAFDVGENDLVEIQNPYKYVSRAGDKLAAAVEAFSLDLKGKVVCDIGSSTGGFTDCCLQNGASKVYCVDVGTSQLVDSLREDPRTVVKENTNARYLIQEDFDEEIDFICMDVSFISVKLILPVYKDILKEKGEAVILIKPQFEVGPKYLDKHGVVKDPKQRERVLLEIISCLKEYGLVKCNYIESPVVGKTGNHEYLLYVRKN